MKIGITGQDGFIGYHLSQTIKYKFEEYTIVPFEREILGNSKLLESFVSSCDVIVHLAGVNRASSNEEVYNSNIQINVALKEALINSSFKGHLIFASSFQEDSSSLYGKAKKESRVFLEQTISKLKGKFTGLIIPNVFGPFCKPNYNSFIATFCSKILIDQNPEIIQDSKVPLIYVGNLVGQIVKNIQSDNQVKNNNIPCDIEIRVSEVLRLLKNIQNEFGLTYLFISHDIHTIKNISNKTAVMYLGAIMEYGDTNKVITEPQHPYTQALLSSVLSPDPTQNRKQIKLVGEIPKVTSIPQGCLFQSRCPNSNNEKKENVERVLVEVGENHFVDQCGASCE